MNISGGIAPYHDRKIQTNEWHSFVIDGELDANADVIYFGDH